MGHTAIQPKKFSETWEKQIHYLGLDFCLLTCTVSMPIVKIDKARCRVLDMLKGTTITKNRLQKLLGSLRHVATCIPAAKPFYQRLQNASKMPSDITMPMTPDIMEDCHWFLAIRRTPTVGPGIYFCGRRNTAIPFLFRCVRLSTHCSKSHHKTVHMAPIR